MDKFIDKVKGGLIVSCQALPDEPLHSSFIMSRMAKAAEESGAIGIRANSIVDIQAIKDLVKLPVIGIMKRVYDGCDVFITPTLKEIRAVCSTGVEVVALDATLRQRPDNMSLKEIVDTIHEEYPHILLMADIATLKEAKIAESIGFDIIGTTLHGYTDETKGCNIMENDFEFLKNVLKVCKKPVIAEGKVDTPDKARRCIELGCLAVVTGGAITRPQEITKLFVKAINSNKIANAQNI